MPIEVGEDVTCTSAPIEARMASVISNVWETLYCELCVSLSQIGSANTECPMMNVTQDARIDCTRARTVQSFHFKPVLCQMCPPSRARPRHSQKLALVILALRLIVT